MTLASSTKRGRFAVALAAVLGLAVGWTSVARADHIDERLLTEAPKIMAYLKEHNYQTVGVLKFTVKKGNDAPTFNAGTMNTKMATRVEHALTLLNDPKKPINILEDVSKTAASSSRSASFRTAQGRRGLLEKNYRRLLHVRGR